MRFKKSTVSGMSYPQFLILLTVIGCFCIIYLLNNTNLFKQVNTVKKTKSNLSYSYTFPMSSCGDKTSGGTNTWYPVNISYNSSNLKRVRRYFCCDAFPKPKLGTIQVASFYNRSRAEKFVKILRQNKFSSAHIGQGKKVTTRPSNQTKNNCKP